MGKGLVWFGEAVVCLIAAPQVILSINVDNGRQYMLYY